MNTIDKVFGYGIKKNSFCVIKKEFNEEIPNIIIPIIYGFEDMKNDNFKITKLTNIRKRSR